MQQTSNKTRVKYLETNVLVEAKKRIHHIINTFDTIYVCFSGGKDSWVLLNLVDQVYKELGIEEKVKVVFRDEEVIPENVIQFVQSVRDSGRFDFRYYCIPLESEKYILGRKEVYVQWDPNRRWLRPKPDFAITSNKVMSQYSADEFITQDSKGKVALMIGIRADESLMRYQGILMKKHESYISDSDFPHIKKVKPIYDWSEKDIFKYFYDEKIPYCQIYDHQVFAKESLRVSTPLHAESAKGIHRLKTMYPLFYSQIIDLFPDVILQERYFRELDREGIIYQYPKSFDGIFQFIREQIEDPKMQKIARERVRKVMITRQNQATAENPSGGYPIFYVFKKILDGAYKRNILPKPNLTKKELEYEKQTV